MPDFMDGVARLPWRTYPSPCTSTRPGEIDCRFSALSPPKNRQSISPGASGVPQPRLRLQNLISISSPPSAFHLLPIGLAGFCWDGKYNALLCQDTENSWLDCGFTAYPSRLVLPADIEGVKLPLCTCDGSMDSRLKPEGKEMIKEIFARKEVELS